MSGVGDLSGAGTAQQLFPNFVQTVKACQLRRMAPDRQPRLLTGVAPEKAVSPLPLPQPWPLEQALWPQ